MKPITGSVVSTKPISLSKAATLMSRFAASDAGAHQEVSAFLRRTSEAFDEFARFQKELRARGLAHGSKGGEEVERKKEKKKKEEPAAIKADQDGSFIGIESYRKKEEERVVETFQAINLAVTEVRSKRKEAVVKVAQDGGFAESGSKGKKKTGKKEEAGTEAAQYPEESKSGSKENKRAIKEIEGRLGNVLEVKTEKSSKHQVKKYAVVNEECEEDAEHQSERRRKKKRKMEQDVKGDNGHVVGNHEERRHKKKRKIKEES